MGIFVVIQTSAIYHPAPNCGRTHSSAKGA